MDKIAVLIPCYNEEKTIEKVVRDAKAALPEAVIYVTQCINLLKHSTDYIAFPLLIFLSHHGTGLFCQLCSAVGRIVVIYINNSLRKRCFCVPDNLFNRFFFVITGNQYRYFIELLFCIAAETVPECRDEADVSVGADHERAYG